MRSRARPASTTKGPVRAIETDPRVQIHRRCCGRGVGDAARSILIPLVHASYAGGARAFRQDILPPCSDCSRARSTRS